MFVGTVRGGHTRDGQQHASGPFLIIGHEALSVFDWRRTTAFVRHVRLEQLGHFMMGHAKLGGVTLTVSGPFGGDGNTMSFPPFMFNAGVPVPPELMDRWNATDDGGHCLQAWAMDNLRDLRKAGRKLRPAAWSVKEAEYDVVNGVWGVSVPGQVRHVDGRVTATWVADSNGYRTWTTRVAADVAGVVVKDWPTHDWYALDRDKRATNVSGDAANELAAALEARDQAMAAWPGGYGEYNTKENL